MDCSICLMGMNPKRACKLDCGHKFHWRCIWRWLKKGNNTCPMCRCPIFIFEDDDESIDVNDVNNVIVYIEHISGYHTD